MRNKNVDKRMFQDVGRYFPAAAHVSVGSTVPLPATTSRPLARRRADGRRTNGSAVGPPSWLAEGRTPASSFL